MQGERCNEGNEEIVYDSDRVLGKKWKSPEKDRRMLLAYGKKRMGSVLLPAAPAGINNIVPSKIVKRKRRQGPPTPRGHHKTVREPRGEGCEQPRLPQRGDLLGKNSFTLLTPDDHCCITKSRIY